MLRLHPSALDIVLLVIYFVAILGIGLAARRSVGTSADFLLAGRTLPAWVTGLAFISANLGATEILGMVANGAQYGAATVHYYWIGAVPARVFLGVVMMPFYYRSKVRSVPEFLRVRYNDSTHVLNALVFALSAVLIAGVNLYALAIVLQSLLGVNLYVGIVVSAAFVLVYIGASGLSSATYGEVLQSLFSIFNAPIFATFILGMFWKKTSAWGGFWGLLARGGSGALTFLLFQTSVFTVASTIYATFIQAGVAFIVDIVDIVVTLAVTAVTTRPDPAELGDIVYTRGRGKSQAAREPWWRRPVLLGGVALAIGLVLNVLFA